MTYQITHRDGTLVANVPDNTLLDGVVPITLIGRGSVNFGPAVNQNTLYLLENFAGIAPPGNPVSGMLWFDTNFDSLKLRTTSGEWLELLTNRSEISGSFKVTNGTDRVELHSDGILTLVRLDGTARIEFLHAPDRELVTLQQSGGDLSVGGGTLKIGNYPVWHAGNFDPSDKLDIEGGTITGDLTVEGDLIVQKKLRVQSLELQGDIRVINPTACDFIIKNDVNNLNRQGPYSGDLGTATNKFNTIYATTFNGTATQALYADLAERYEVDQPYPVGTLVKIGGAKEVTQTTGPNDGCLGVVSERPAYLMNAGAGSDITHPPICLAGRVRVRVTGKARKGDRLVVSDVPGVATSIGKDADLADNVEALFRMVIGSVGWCLEDKDDEDEGLVFAVIGAK